MRKFLPYLIAAVLAGLLLPTPATADDDYTVALVGKAKFIQKCAWCHTPDKALQHKKDRAGWIKTVWVDMREKKPALFASYTEAEKVVDFLTRERGR